MELKDILGWVCSWGYHPLNESIQWNWKAEPGQATPPHPASTGIHSMELKGLLASLASSALMLKAWIHSMELKVAVVAGLASCPSCSTESIQWNWKRSMVLARTSWPFLSHRIHSMELKAGGSTGGRGKLVWIHSMELKDACSAWDDWVWCTHVNPFNGIESRT